MQISVSSNVREVAGRLQALRYEARTATAKTLTGIARDIKIRDIPKTTREDIDRPTPATQKGALWERANETNLTSAVIIKPWVWKYLQGIVNPRTEVSNQPIPTRAGLQYFQINEYGNLPRRAIKQANRDPNTFWGTVYGAYGLWLRQGRRVVRIAHVPRTRRYSDQVWDYDQVVEAGVNKRFNRQFAYWLNREIQKGNRKLQRSYRRGRRFI